jgi:PRTRC genetic system protein E
MNGSFGLRAQWRELRVNHPELWKEKQEVFTELMPLLKQRVVMITISDVGEGMLRLNVIPRKLEADSDENAALTTPLTITGKAEELDRDLPGQLASFKDSILKTGSNLEELKTQHAAAIKAIEAETKKRLDEKKKGNGSKVGGTTAAAPKTSPAADFKDAKPVFGTKPLGTVTGESRSLFDAAGDGTDNKTVEPYVEQEDEQESAVPQTE